MIRPDTQGRPLWMNALVFAVAAIAVWQAGTRARARRLDGTGAAGSG